jgi:hypothetical protein
MPSNAQLTNPPPFLRHVCVASDELPERIRLYRGGTRDPVALGGGLSWSRHRGTAAWYALRRVRELGGKPIVVRAMVRCDQIAMVTRNTESEWVAFDVAGAELVPTSASMLRKQLTRAQRSRTSKLGCSCRSTTRRAGAAGRARRSMPS